MLQIPQIEFQEHRLSNGLQVLLYSNRRTPLVHVSVHYRVGSSVEEPGLSGFAHLFEHMMFQGSDNVDKNEHGRYVDEVGGRWNASTNKDRTNYYETLPSNCLELGLWLEADRMRSLKVTEANFENQRQTVIEEKKQSYDNRPYGLAYLRFDELAYESWAYAHSVIGSVSDLQKATLEDAARFHRTYYGPGNATLVLAGDLDCDEALESVRKHFADIPNRTSSEGSRVEEPEQSSEKREELTDPLAVLPLVILGYHMPPIGSPEYYALSLFSIVLSDGSSSRLHRKLIYEDNWVTGLAAGPNRYKGPGLFDFWMQIQDQIDVHQVLEAIEGELERLRVQPISQQELEKALNQLAYRHVGRLQKVSDIGEILAHYAVYHDAPNLINQEWERFLSVTPATIREVVRDTFRAENRTLLLVQPQAAPQEGNGIPGDEEDGE